MELASFGRELEGIASEAAGVVVGACSVKFVAWVEARVNAFAFEEEIGVSFADRIDFGPLVDRTVAEECFGIAFVAFGGIALEVARILVAFLGKALRCV